MRPAMPASSIPNNLADGVEAPKNDKILPMRSLDYAVSFGRRQTN